VPYTTLKNAKIGEKIDYLAYSQANSLEFNFPPYIDGQWKDINPLKNYTHGQENKQGVRKFWNDISDQQGKYVILSGQPLDTIAVHRSDFLQWVHTSQKKVTRIDYALDIILSKFSAKLVRKHLLNGEGVTHAKKLPTAGELVDEADTQYIGTKSSETYTRVYNKAVEQSVDFSWTRIETVYQGERANPSIEEYFKYKSVRPLIKRHIDFPDWQDWQEIMQAQTAQLFLPSKVKSTRTWLLTQVCKTIAKELMMDDGKEFWDLMQQQILVEIDRLKDETTRIS